MIDMEEKIKQSLRNSRLILPIKPTSAGVRFLRYINRVIGAFEDVDILSQNDIASWMEKKGYKHKPKTIENRYQIAKGFGLMKRKGQVFTLTLRGKQFRDAIGIYTKAMDLSTEQKDILRNFLKEGIDSSIKSTIFIFLHFIKETEGEWIPKSTMLSDEDCRIISKFLGKGKILKPSTIGDMFEWAYNYCEDLGLVRMIEIGRNNFRVSLTSRGEEIYGLPMKPYYAKKDCYK